MEQKNISFGKGIQRSPSLAADGGELSECVNLIPKNGELVNLQPAEAIGVQVEGTLVCLHKVSNDTNYIVKDTDKGHWFLYYYNNKQTKGNICECSENAHIQPIGNILVITDGAETHYAIWESGDASEYSYNTYGTIPQLKMDFSLEGKAEYKSYNKVAAIVSGINENENLEYIDTFKYTFPVEGGTQSMEWSASELFADGLNDGRTYRAFVKKNRLIKLTIMSQIGGYPIEIYGSSEDRWADFVMHTDTTIRAETDKHLIEFSIYEVKVNAEDPESGVSLAVNNKDESHLNAIMGSAMDFIDVYSYEQKGFIFPFYVRYGLRMYDNSVIQQSAPILMIPNNDLAPTCLIKTLKYNYDEDGESMSDLSMIAFVCKLHYSVANAVDFEQWKDLVVGVDVAISAPIYKIDEGVVWNKSINRFKIRQKNYALNNAFGIFNAAKNYLKDQDNIQAELTADYAIMLPSKPDSVYIDELKSTSLFYTIKQYTWDELSGGQVDMEDVNLKNITTLKQMPDDVSTHSTYGATNTFVYNDRMNFANITEQVSIGLTALSPVIDSEGKYRILVRGKRDGQDFTVVSDWKQGSLSEAQYLYVTMKGATEAIIYRQIFLQTEIWQKAQVSLTDHARLQGGLHFGKLTFNICSSDEVDNLLNGVKDLIYFPSKIIQSGVGNPFVFPGELQRSIGTGKILKISTAAKALSSGTQHGAFPLICFADDGIWHLEVNTDGTYSTPNPTSRDILTNEESVAQMDSAVVFATDKGLMMLEGSTVKYLSAAMEGENADENIFFADIADEHKDLVVRDIEPISNTLSNCKTMWDYSNGLIHFYPKEDTVKHYVYDVANDVWAEYVGSDSKAKAVVQDYPYSIIQNNSGNLLRHTKRDRNDKLISGTYRRGLILTRETAFDDPFTMKMLADLRMSYTKHFGTKCWITVFVSNDRQHWHKMKSLHAHSWKWYRFRIRTTMLDIDALSGLSCWTETRRTNKLR